MSGENFYLMGKHDRSKKKKNKRNHKKSDYLKIYSRFKRLYRSWGERVFCPELGNYVYFTGLFLIHVRKERGRYQNERRLKLLPLTKILIETSPNLPTRHTRNYLCNPTTYWKLSARMENVEIVAIIIKPYDKYIFLSDFEFEEFR